MQGMKNRDGEINGYTFTGETQNQTHKSICRYFQAGIFLAAAFIDAAIQREGKISCSFNYACITFQILFSKDQMKLRKGFGQQDRSFLPIVESKTEKMKGESQLPSANLQGVEYWTLIHIVKK